jgi:hypothetical protein
MKNKHIIGIFEDEQMVVKALKQLQDNKVEVNDIYGPCADHDLLKTFTKKSRIPHLAFIYAVLSIIAMFSFLYYTSVIDYPLRYGGKPIFSFPPMVVLMFLATILLTSTLSVFTLLGRIRIFPGKPAKIVDQRQLDDRFVMLISNPGNPDSIKKLLIESGATEIKEEEIDQVTK